MRSDDLWEHFPSRLSCFLRELRKAHTEPSGHFAGMNIHQADTCCIRVSQRYKEPRLQKMHITGADPTPIRFLKKSSMRVLRFSFSKTCHQDLRALSFLFRPFFGILLSVTIFFDYNTNRIFNLFAAATHCVRANAANKLNILIRRREHYRVHQSRK